MANTPNQRYECHWANTRMVFAMIPRVACCMIPRVVFAMIPRLASKGGAPASCGQKITELKT